MCKKFVPMRVDFDATNPDNKRELATFREKTTQTFNGMGKGKGGAIISSITADKSDVNQVIIHISGKATKHQQDWVNQRLG